ncbi:MAG: Glucosamine-6-phosphate deaminase [Candidatus Gottesmanbacteria bacterium GW2011_GWA2_43_14]|uniref:Glucosamine-6-phosphate deaminase n=1 Tax=Candidatus Gottesmanbacteria bacterium GW2011_GWA2_43_14 TaxID=1618443 RepID=A0A0G1DDR0_9BACT|nr:MAG: Glucosamine-6-phosphate deaminase [Candidatus Gottesmanbacteria bacterium GW2011_GWA2_43_14]
MLARLECQDITSAVIGLREENGVPDNFDHNGVIYQVYHPSVLVMPDQHILSQTALQKTYNTLSDFPGYAGTFPTGGTWEEHYALMAANAGLFAPLFNGRPIASVDEYYPLGPDNPNYPISYRVYTDIRIGIPMGIHFEQWIRPNSAASDPNEEAARFERELQSESFALTNLGIGPDPKMADGTMIPEEFTEKQIARLVAAGRAVEGSPHIGFVPKGTSPDSGAIYVKLDRGTIFANSQGAPDPDNMPSGAITQGPADFLRSQIRVMMASGIFKPRNVEKVLLEPPSVENPASLVTLGESVILLDQAAAGRVLNRIIERQATVFRSASLS